MQMLSTDASPPPGLSFGYMLAGLAGMCGALLLLVLHPEALLTRWHPAALAAVHLFALGGLMPVMLGALFQFVPVACGLSLPRWGWIDFALLGLLWVGAWTLAIGFLQVSPWWYATAGGMLLTSLVVSVLRLLSALYRQARQAAVIGALGSSVAALGVTLLLAVLLLGILLFGWNLPLVTLVDWHALWATVGWVGGLVSGVAGVVVPMFHVSPAYPAGWTKGVRLLHPLLAIGLLAACFGRGWLVSASCMLLALMGLAFGFLTVVRVIQSRRGEKDAFYWGWIAIGCLVTGTALASVAALFTADARWEVLFGLLMLLGVGGFSVSVMLYRIVPFLIWLHWQRANKARARLPLLHRIVPEWGQCIHLGLELLGLGLLCLGCFLPAWVRAGGLCLLAGRLLQLVLLVRAIRDFRERLIVLRNLPPRSRRAAS